MAIRLTFILLFLGHYLLEGQTIIVNDTDFSKGRLGFKQEVSLSDLEKFHGHMCDGLVEGFLALQFGLQELYPDGVVDRTNTRVITKSSPCLTDAAIYLTGGRTQYNTFYIDNSISSLFIIQRLDTGKALEISRRPNVKPQMIDVMGDQAIRNELDPCALEELKRMEEEYSEFLLTNSPQNLFEIVEIPHFKWLPKFESYLKTDVLNKHQKPCEH
ncbi:MAG: formylmethanofuran dehydrogenase subunit E family protein [Flavobacterium sp.]